MRFEYAKDNEINTVKTYEYGLPKNTFHQPNSEYSEFCGNECGADGIFNCRKCIKCKLNVYAKRKVSFFCHAFLST